LVPEGTGSLRPGGRTARTREAVAAALQAELVEVGYAGVTIDRVARRAGVAKTTVYRRWGSVGQLVVDVFAHAAGLAIPFADTGTLEGDLRELNRAVVALLHSPDRAVFDVVVREAVHDPAARAALTGFFAHRLGSAAVIVRRAEARGEVPPGTDAVEVIKHAAAPIYTRLYITGEPVGPADADRAADVAALAARAGLLRAAGTGRTGLAEDE
jgi:AcrR family transcriptional regulator